MIPIWRGLWISSSRAGPRQRGAHLRNPSERGIGNVLSSSAGVRQTPPSAGACLLLGDCPGTEVEPIHGRSGTRPAGLYVPANEGAWTGLVRVQRNFYP